MESVSQNLLTPAVDVQLTEKTAAIVCGRLECKNNLLDSTGGRLKHLRRWTRHNGRRPFILLKISCYLILLGRNTLQEYGYRKVVYDVVYHINEGDDNFRI